jgi:hypothetical protein
LKVTTVVSPVDGSEGILIEPLSCNCPPEPETTIASDPNLPILTVLSANASITGTPAIVLAENIELDKSSVISNNLPLAPSTENIVVVAPDPDPLKLATSAVPDTINLEPSNVINASALIVDELTEVNTLLSPGFV